MKIIKKSVSLDYSPILSNSSIRCFFEDDLRKAEQEADALTEQQTKEVLDFWNGYTVLDSVGWAAYYTKRNGSFDVRYVPHDLFYAEIDRILNQPVRAYGIDDKLLFYRIFPVDAMPELLASKTGSVIYDGNSRIITVEKALQICTAKGEVVLKPTIATSGGIGVKFFSLPEEAAALEAALKQDGEFIIQSKIKQHTDLAVFHPQSINTIRTLTYQRENGEVVVLSSVLRMGSGNMQVDNHCSGGCTCGICKDGTLNDTGFTNDGYRSKTHPDGVPFANHSVPSYDRIVETAKNLHYRLPQFPMLSWDFSVGEDGRPVLIEMNIGKPSIDFMQLNNGPLFGDYTTEILDRVYRFPLKR